MRWLYVVQFPLASFFFLGICVRYTHIRAPSDHEGFSKSWADFNFFGAVCVDVTIFGFFNETPLPCGCHFVWNCRGCVGLVFTHNALHASGILLTAVWPRRCPNEIACRESSVAKKRRMTARLSPGLMGSRYNEFFDSNGRTRERKLSNRSEVIQKYL